MSPFKRPFADNATIRKTDLYKVELLLREANKISQFLKKNTAFSRLDYMENEKVKTVIKVTNNKLGVCTNWTVPKFEEKLIQMRDLYQNETEGSADDEVFNDPEDTWEQDQKAPSPFIKSPKSRYGSRRSFQSPNNRSSVMSSVSSLDDSYRVGTCCCRIKTCQSMSSTCKNFVVDILENIKDGKMEVSLGDKILESCNRMKQVVTMVMDLYCNEDSISNSLDNNTETLHTNCISLVTSYHSLASDSSLWTTTLLEDNQHSSFLQDLTKKFRDLTKSVGNQIVLFFQGCENSIDSLVQESCENLKNILLDLCKVVGELALATDTCIKSIEPSTEDTTRANSSSDICMSFLNGCDVFIDKSLQGGIKSLEDWKSKAQSYTSNTADKLNLGEIPIKVEFVVNSAIDLLSNCQELQVEVNSSMHESIDSLPSEYYSINYRRSQGLVNQVSDLVEKTGLLMQQTQPVLEGQDGDLRKVSRCAEMIQKSAIQLLVSSNTDKRRTISDSIDQSDCSVLSTIQMEQLEHAARELKTGAQSLIEQVDKVMSYDRQVSTPRGRRLLPASPDRAAASPVTRAVTIKRL